MWGVEEGLQHTLVSVVINIPSNPPPPGHYLLLMVYSTAWKPILCSCSLIQYKGQHRCQPSSVLLAQPHCVTAFTGAPMGHWTERITAEIGSRGWFVAEIVWSKCLALFIVQWMQCHFQYICMYECVSTFNQESHAPVFTVVDTVASEWSSAVDAAVSSAVLWITALCEMRT